MGEAEGSGFVISGKDFETDLWSVSMIRVEIEKHEGKISITKKEESITPILDWTI